MEYRNILKEFLKMRYLVFLLALFLLAGIRVYAKTGKGVPKLITKPQLSINEGSSSKIKISGENIIKVKYQSSDKAVAVVNSKGKVTAKGAGQCKINIDVFYKVKSNKKSFIVDVNVKSQEDKSMPQFIVRVNGTDFNAKLYNTDAARKFYGQFPLKINMSELNGNEKYYYMDNTFQEEKENIGLIHAGDIMLYGDNCLVLFYDTFKTSYTYTKIGYIENPEELAKELGNGNVKVSFCKK